MTHPHITRRTVLRQSVRVATLGTFAALAVPARASNARSLAFVHLHTGERIEVAFALGERYDSGALGALNHFLRDHYSGEVGTMDPAVFDQLHRVRLSLARTSPFEVISGYRAPATNDRLRAGRGGGVAKHSLHMQGRAIDVRLAGVPLPALRDAALALRVGGVGYYPREQFVHLDSGRVRTW